ncbi:MAG: hypothetical protein NVS4B3_25950 [Gemmatimonadaceae bacterium]
MCRNIKTLSNFEPPATEAEVRASALQFVRKLSGVTRPSRMNEIAFNRAVEEVAGAAQRLIQSLKTHAPPRDRDDERQKARQRMARRLADSVRRLPVRPPSDPTETKTAEVVGHVGVTS